MTKRIASQHLHPLLFTSALLKNLGIFSFFAGPSSLDARVWRRARLPQGHKSTWGLSDPIVRLCFGRLQPVQPATAFDQPSDRHLGWLTVANRFAVRDGKLAKACELQQILFLRRRQFGATISLGLGRSGESRLMFITDSPRFA